MSDYLRGVLIGAVVVIAVAQGVQCGMQYRSEQRAEAVRAEIMRQVPAEPSERGSSRVDRL